MVLETLIVKLLELSPAIAILLYLVVRQDRRNARLIDILAEHLGDCEEQIEQIRKRLDK